MKAKHLISVILLSGVVMGTGFCSNDNQQKIRSKFNIEESYCAIKTNGVLGFSNRRSARRANGDSTGAISSTNAMMLMANGENEISLEIGALGWFSDKPASMEERGVFSKSRMQPGFGSFY